MDYFLAKTDPETYSLADFEREGRTVWDGVRNAQAVKAIRAMKPGDRVFIYHSGGESAIVGWAEVRSEPRPDPNESRSAIVEMEFRGRLDPPVTLAEIKADGAFADWALVRQSRLSTMQAQPEFAKWMRKRYPKAGL